MQGCGVSIANALEILQSYSKPSYDDVIKWKHFPRYWPFVRGIDRSPVNSPHKGQWRRALMFSLIFAGTNSWENHWDAGDLRHHCAHYDVTVMDMAYGLCGVMSGTLQVDIIDAKSKFIHNLPPDGHIMWSTVSIKQRFFRNNTATKIETYTLASNGGQNKKTYGKNHDTLFNKS